MTILILIAVVLLAFANGANDNFKGVATLFGSGSTNYRLALIWANLTTLMGSIAAVFFAEQLLQKFSGRGLVSETLATNPAFAASVAIGAGLTVLLATRFGMPISTTHGLIGAIIGSGLVAGEIVNWSKLSAGFFVPLLLSPLLAGTATVIVYWLLHQSRQRLGICQETCFCVGSEIIEVVPSRLNSVMAATRVEELTLSVGNAVSCRSRYLGRAWGIEIGSVLQVFHFLSAGFVGFARAFNDTPKIAALLLVVPFIPVTLCSLIVGFAILAGGWLAAKRVAEVVSHKITRMNDGQGFTANAVTSSIVIAASIFHLPVSTTHVSCGSVMGIGAVTGEGNWRLILKILGAWGITLPIGALLGAAAMGICRMLAIG
jgi:PiT family inorganic phosphate transporter